MQFAYQTLVAAHGESIRVERQAKLTDNRGNVYKIDVSYSFDVAGITHNVAIECKDTQRPVERDEAIAFAGKVQDLPNTVGVMISTQGFQKGARDYLSSRGINCLSRDQLPTFGQVVGSMLARVALPSAAAIGQPFWTLMEVSSGDNTGTWFVMPLTALGLEQRDADHYPENAFILFLSKRHAEQFNKSFRYMPSGFEVRGIEQPSLRFVLLAADGERMAFVLLRPEPVDGEIHFRCEPLTARELADEYYPGDATELFDRPSRIFRRF